MDPLNVLAKFEILSFYHAWDNRGYPKNLCSPWIRPSFLFSKIYHGLLFGWTLLVFWPNLKFVALPIPEIIAIGVLGGMRTPNLGEGEAVGGRWWYRSKERRWVPIGPHSNFFFIFTRFRGKNGVNVLSSVGALKMLDVKMTDVKLTDQSAGHEIAGHENDGPNDRTWKCRTWNSRT